MSIRLMSEIWKSATSVKSERLLVLLALADWANDEGVCWPSMEQIAEKARTSKGGAKSIVAWLEEEGYLTIKRGVGRGNRSTYTVHPNPVKGYPKDPFEEIKGHAENPFQDDVKGHPEQQKVILNDIKGHPEHSRIDSTCAGLTINKPPVNKPSDAVRESFAETDSAALAGDNATTARQALLQAVLKATGKALDWQMGTISSKFRIGVTHLVAKLERDRRTPEDVMLFSQRLPAYLGRDPATFSPPQPSQMLDVFDAVMNFNPDQNRNQHANQREHKSVTNLRNSLIYK